MLGVYYHRRKKGQHFCIEIFFKLFLSSVRKLGIGKNVYALFCKVALEVGENVLAHFVKAGRSFGNGVKLHCKSQFCFIVARVGAQLAFVVKAAHAHHKKFVEIGGEYR